MAKNNFLSWDTTAGNNTDVGGISILGTAAVNNFDDALRTIMAQLRSGVDGEVVYAAKSSGYTAVANDNNGLLRFTASATLALTAAATLAANWHITVMAQGGDVTIDPNASETINGATTLLVRDGQAAFIVCNGTAFFATVVSTAIFGIKGADIASAATTDLSTATGDYVNITGTTTITSFGTAPAGIVRTVRFTGALTLTYNATSMILYSKADILTYDGLVMEFRSLGSGNWIEVSQTQARNTWTPTVSASVGSLTAYTASGLYIRAGRLVFVEITVDVTNNGTGSQSIGITLPFVNGATARGVFSGTNLNTGKMMQGNSALSSQTAIFTYYDNTYPSATGAQFRLAGSYIMD